MTVRVHDSRACELLALFEAQRQPPATAAQQDGLLRDIQRILDAERSDPMVSEWAPPEIRQATILLSDLRGFMFLAERYSGLEMVKLLDRYLRRMSAIILAHGGRVDKFMGDAILAIFDRAVEPAQDVEAALSCAVAMQIAMDDVNQESAKQGMPPLFMGIGISTGDVVVGWLGSDAHREYTVIGDQVNLASRIEAHSLRGQILLSESTYGLAKDYIEIGDINEIRVKGRQSAITIYELLATRQPGHLQVPRREIRHAPRVKVDLNLKFQLLVGKTVQPPEHAARMVDISYGGMRIESDLQLEVMSEIRISMSPSLRGGAFSEIYARVLGLALVNNRPQYRLEFTAIEDGCAQAVKALVDDLMTLQGKGG